MYAAGTHERFPDGGKMSQYLKSLAIGASLEIAGPFGHVTYVSLSSDVFLVCCVVFADPLPTDGWVEFAREYMYVASC